MFNKKKKQKVADANWEQGFLDAINYSIFILQLQKERHGDVASITDMIELIGKDL